MQTTSFSTTRCYRQTSAWFAALMGLVLFGARPAHAQVNLALNAIQGFTFKKDVSTPSGYLKTFSLGATTLSSDFQVTDPTNAAAAPLYVAAVLTKVYWDGHIADPIQLEGRISAANESTVQAWMHIFQPAGSNVSFSIETFAFDPVAKCFFPSFYGSTDGIQVQVMNGTIARNGFSLNPSPCADVTSPKNYVFTISINPLPTQRQTFIIGSSNTQFLVKSWGMTQP